MKIRDVLKPIIPHEHILTTIRAAARKNGKSALSKGQIDREVRAYRRGRPARPKRQR